MSLRLVPPDIYAKSPPADFSRWNFISALCPCEWRVYYDMINSRDHVDMRCDGRGKHGKRTMKPLQIGRSYDK